MRRCDLCRVHTIALESHHVVPVAYGGKKDGLQVSICSNCHRMIHKCIENINIDAPGHLLKCVSVGREAKRQFKAGQLAAKDRRPTLIIDLSEEEERLLKQMALVFNTNSRAKTMKAALRFAAENVRRA